MCFGENLKNAHVRQDQDIIIQKKVIYHKINVR